MFYNNATCDIYIGTGAGKKLMREIENSKRSVKIVSPFLSPFLVKKLIELHKRNIKIQLITTDTIEDFYGNRDKNIHQLILQDRTIDKDMETLCLKWKNRKRLFQYLFTGIFVILFVMGYWLQNFRVLFGFLPLFIIWYMIRNYSSKIRNVIIYSYSYRQLFPFKVFESSNNQWYPHTFVHGKMYLIDDEIAYLGSLNFTGNGTKSNYETRIRITDQRALKELANEFDVLFQNEDMPERDITSWGKELYVEPRN